MGDLKVYQIPRSILAKEPKPVIQLDLLEALQDHGFDVKDLETPQTLSLLGRASNLIVAAMGYTAKTNYGVVSVFDASALEDYERLVESCRIGPASSEAAATADQSGASKKKKKKKRK